MGKITEGGGATVETETATFSMKWGALADSKSRSAVYLNIETKSAVSGQVVSFAFGEENIGALQYVLHAWERGRSPAGGL